MTAETYGMAGDKALFHTGKEGADRARAMFSNQGMHAAAIAFASVHERGIQYLEQAPVLALGSAFGSTRQNRQIHLFIALRLVPLCERGAPLKEVMRAFNIAPPLRQLRASALFPSAAPSVWALSTIEPAVLGRIVPEKPGLQKRWLSAMVEWRAFHGRRVRADSQFAWAAENISKARVERRAITEVADYIVSGQPFNTAWGWNRASDEATRWHSRIQLDQLLRGTPFKPETQLDLSEHPNVTERDDLFFVALRTPIDLAEEGSAMHHCVATYIQNVASGNSHIISIRDNERRVATAGFGRKWALIQLKGPCNAQVTAAIRGAAENYGRIAKLAAA